MSATQATMPDELSPRRLRRRLVQVAAIVALIVLLVRLGPGLGSVRHHIAHASAGWLAAAVGLELLSALSYVVIFRAVFCSRMSWGLSYQIGMAEQAANSVLSVSGAGGLALGAWALRRGGMSPKHIARRTVAFFFLTSLANVLAVVVFAGLYALGILHHDRNPVLTYGFGAAALTATVVVLALPALLADSAIETQAGGAQGKVRSAVRFLRHSVGQGIGDALQLLGRRSPGVVIGSLGTMAFDLAVLGVSFRALGYSPPVGVLALGYLIGQLGGNLPVPGGIGGIDGGLIGVFALYHQPIAVTTGAVLIYHAVALWLPALLGSAAFAQLRSTLRHQSQPAAICMPLAEPIDLARQPAIAR